MEHQNQFEGGCRQATGGSSEKHFLKIHTHCYKINSQCTGQISAIIQICTKI